MVRLSTYEDINGIIAVWREAFGDSEKDIRFFLDSHYKPENTVVSVHNGELASVLFLIDGDMHIGGGDYPSYYLYAACTLKKFRGRGMMTELLDFSKQIAYERGKYFIALKPAEKSLFDFYSKFGYQSVFSKKIISFNRKDLKIKESVNNSYSYFKWDNYSVKFAIEHHKYYGGFAIRDSDGFLLYTVNDGGLFIKENSFPTEKFFCIINELSIKHGTDNFRAELPAFSPLECDKDEIVKSGMLLPVSSDAEYLIDTVYNAYLSLTLD